MCKNDAVVVYIKKDVKHSEQREIILENCEF